MNQYKVQYSPAALTDLDEIWGYIAIELCNPDAAYHTVNTIMDCVESLEYNPLRGTLLSNYY